jgi:iron(III) transport system substrate-binding protein
LFCRLGPDVESCIGRRTVGGDRHHRFRCHGLDLFAVITEDAFQLAGPTRSTGAFDWHQQWARATGGTMAEGFSRRTIVKGAAATAVTLPAQPFSTRVVSAAPPPERVTPELIAAATKEGVLHCYTAMDISAAENMAKGFEAAYPGIKVRIERSGSERIFARIAQEYSSNIHRVDFVNTADAAHMLPWKRQGWLAPFLPEEAVQHFAADQIDSDGMFVNHRSHTCPMAYNTKLVSPEDAPKSYADLLNPKWSGKIVKAHPSYSGTILTATFEMVRDMGGWSYFEGLAKQKVMQVQSATDPPKKLAIGERAIMADGTDYLVVLEKAKGAPVELIYPTEGTPLISNPSCVFKAAPNPNAARLFQCWMLSAPGQQHLVNVTSQYPSHALVKASPNRKPLKDIKTLKEDPAGVEAQAEEIKARYTQLFKV